MPARKYLTCTVEGCDRKHYGRGVCVYHYARLPEVIENRRKTGNIRQKTEKRREQKRHVQAVYSHKPEKRFLKLKKYAKKPVDLTVDEFVRLVAMPCAECGKQLEPTGIGVGLIDPKGRYSLENSKPHCSKCRLRKPIKEFNPIEHSKRLLRRYWKRTPMATLAELKARVAPNTYECRSCKQLFPKKDVQLDHATPVVDPVLGFRNLDEYAIRLYCGEENLQMLCKPCHHLKTASENLLRAPNGKRKKV